MSKEYRMSIVVETKGAESQVQSFSQKLLDAAKSSESLNKAINNVQAGFGKIGSAMGSAKSAFAGLNQGADKAEDSIDKLKSTIEKLGFSIEKGRLKNAKGDFVTLGDGAENASEDVKKLVKELEQLGYKVNSAGKITDLSGKFAKLGNAAEEASKGMDGMNGAVAKLNGTLGLLKSAFVGAMAFAGIGSIIETSDAMKTLDSQIKIATKSAEKHAIAMSEIERIAMANHVSLQSVGGLYVSNERALKQLGKSQQEVIKFTEQVTMAMRLGGGSAEAQAAALTQLGQAMASGVLRGDEFNSISEQAPMIMELMADSLGVTTSELRKMAEQGKLTADAVYKAMTSAEATEKLKSMSQQTSTTISGAMENLRTQWDLTVHKLMNGEGGISGAIAGGIDKVANGLAKFKEYIPQINEHFSSVTSLISENSDVFIALASGIGAAAAAFGVFTFVTAGIPAIMAGVSSAFALLLNPITLTVLAIGALVAAGVLLYKNWDTIKAKASEVWPAVSSKVTEVVSNVKGKFEELKAKAEAIFNSLPAPARAALSAIGAVFSAQFSVIKTVVSTSFALIKNAFATAFAAIKSLVRGDMDGVKQAINNGMKNAWNIVKNGVTNIVGAFKNLGSQLKQAGRDAVQGFINGIDEKIGAAVAKAKELASRAKNAVTGFLDIRSPSRVMREIGAWAGEGFVLGIDDKVEDAKQAAKNLANALTNTVQDLHRQNFMLLNTANPLADLEYKLQFGELADLTDQQKNRLRELATINIDIQKANEATAKAMQEQAAAQDNLNNKIKNYQDSLAKNSYLYRNKGDKYAGERWDLSQQGFDDKQIDQIVEKLRQSDIMSAMVNMPKTLTMPTLQNNNVGSAVSSAVTGYFDLKTQLDNNLAIIKEAENAKLITEQEGQAARLEQESAFHEARQNLVIAGADNILGSMASATKAMLGEQSSAYRAMFALQQGFAIGAAIVNMHKAISDAFAEGTTLAQKIAGVAVAASQGMKIVTAIQQIRNPVVGQAHDGIMSVPKSGTWNLEKGERVLPKHTAKALDDKLDGMGSGGAVNNINVNVSVDSNGGDVTSAHSFGKRLGDAIRTAVQKELHNERRQGGLLYGA